ncbi:TlpA family protein disulfide reductase [Mucilaginibacter sp.]|uniref:TlpA family protein disulfide reductase n=1 Tax=Mucilaginibacter sp. TaxID=1882438 RepID=UPI00356750A7
MVGLVLTVNAYAQTPATKPLTIGEQVPDLTYNLHIGDEEENIRLSDFKGKLILLDFWGVDCPTCIQEMPHMLELQEKFKDRIKVILVTQDSKEDIAILWKNLAHSIENAKKYVKAGSRLPFIVSDTTLRTLFRPTTLGEHVWIDGDRLFRALTHPTTTIAANIQDFLDGKKVKLYNVETPHISLSDPLTWLDPKNKLQDHVAFYSLIMHRIEATIGWVPELAIGRDSITKKLTQIRLLNKSAVELYEYAHFKDFVPLYKVLLKVKDPSDFFLNTDDDLKTYQWQENHQYCYALKIPATGNLDACQIMRQDLDRYFHYTSKVEYVKVKCLILKQTTKGTIKPSKSASYSILNKVTPNGLVRVFKKVHIRSLMEHLQSIAAYHDKFIELVDETGYKGKFDAEVPGFEDPEFAKKITVPTLQSALKLYGLGLEEGYRIRKRLVITGN